MIHSIHVGQVKSACRAEIRQLNMKTTCLKAPVENGSEIDGESCEVLSHGFPKYLFVAICLALYFLLKINKLAAAARHDRIQYFLSLSKTILNKPGAFYTYDPYEKHHLKDHNHFH
ncbi:hypothetical protein V6N13_146660 [Hibiscus sabdariffa]